MDPANIIEANDYKKKSDVDVAVRTVTKIMNNNVMGTRSVRIFTCFIHQVRLNMDTDPSSIWTILIIPHRIHVPSIGSIYLDQLFK